MSRHAAALLLVQGLLVVRKSQEPFVDSAVTDVSRSEVQDAVTIECCIQPQSQASNGEARHYIAGGQLITICFASINNSTFQGRSNAYHSVKFKSTDQVLPAFW